MEIEEDTGDPFAIDDLWRVSKFAFAPIEPLPPILKTQEETDLIRLDHLPFERQFIPFPELEQSLINFSDWTPLPDNTLEPIEDLTISSDSDAARSYIEDEGAYEDIWALGDDLISPKPSTKLLTWDSFLDPNFVEPQSAYLSEHGPIAFDTALALRSDQRNEKPGRNVKSNVYLRALQELGLGRNSLFFRFDSVADIFLQDVEDVSLSGVSLQAMESVIEDFIECGSSMKKLRGFIHETMFSYQCSPARFSLASVISKIIFSLEAQLETSIPSDPSLLQLNTLFQRSGTVTRCLLDLVSSTRLTESDEELMSIVFKKTERLLWQHEWVAGLLNEVVLRVADPWLIFVEGWIGLQPLSSLSLENGHSFVKINSREITNEKGIKGMEIDYEMNSEKIPSYLSPDDARTIFETGKCLRLLSDLRTEHPLVMLNSGESSDSPSLRWASSWTDLERIHTKANEYEISLRSTLQQYYKNGEIPRSKQHISNSEDAIEISMPWWPDRAPQLEPIDARQLLGKPLINDSEVVTDPIYHLLQETEWYQVHSSPTKKIPFAPPFTLAPTLSMAPILNAQARLVDFSCIHLLFSEYELMSHLSLQRRFHLFGDGVFTSRLSQALFEPEMASADRRSGKVRGGSSTGLRLGDRDTWPPAHSELRLVLTGLLNDAYNPKMHETNSKIDELPGGLSFSVRELSEEEMEKCRDPNGVEALDFLRLQYKPPRALETIITPVSLYKYDRLFKFLLRIVRMLAVVRGLIRDVTDRSSRVPQSRFRDHAQKFRVDAHHFISTLCNYSLTTAVDQAWEGFETRLTAVASHVKNEDFDGTLRHAKSIVHLREAHEEMLDHIIFALLLTKKQAKVRTVLEDILRTVLEFAPLSRRHARGESEPGHEGEEIKIRELHAKFRKLVSTFIRVLRTAEEGRGLRRKENTEGASLDHEGKGMGTLSERDRVNEGRGFERLLVRLEMNGYYMR